MNIPAKVKINKNVYTTRVVESMGCVRGNINYATKTITICKKGGVSGAKYSKKERSATMMHEIVHAVLKEINHTQYADEKFVKPLADELVSALRQCGVNV